MTEETFNKAIILKQDVCDIEGRLRAISELLDEKVNLKAVIGGSYTINREIKYLDRNFISNNDNLIRSLLQEEKKTLEGLLTVFKTQFDLLA